MKVVMLTCSTGQGHNAAAEAVREALLRGGAQCETLDVLSFLGKRASGVIAGAFVGLAVNTPRAFGLMYQAGEKLSDTLGDRAKSPVYLANTLYADHLAEYLAQSAADAAVCPHLFPAEALTCLKRAGRVSARCYFVSTDYTCIPFLDETDMDEVFIPSEDLAVEFTTRGMDERRLFASGVPVSARYAAPRDRAAARAQLHVPGDIPVFLVMTGGEGCGDAVTLARGILMRLQTRDARVFVLTGRNERLRERLNAALGADARAVAAPFTTQVALYMDACDVLLSKPGGISSTEAAVRGVPLIHTAPIPGCETLNARFFSQRGMSILAPDDASAADSALRLAADQAQRARMLAAQRQYVPQNAADIIAKRIIANM